MEDIAYVCLLSILTTRWYIATAWALEYGKGAEYHDDDALCVSYPGVRAPMFYGDYCAGH